MTKLWPRDASKLKRIRRETCQMRTDAKVWMFVLDLCPYFPSHWASAPAADFESQDFFPAPPWFQTRCSSRETACWRAWATAWWRRMVIARWQQTLGHSPDTSLCDGSDVPETLVRGRCWANAWVSCTCADLHSVLPFSSGSWCLS